jgi:hypothetical protein
MTLLCIAMPIFTFVMGICLGIIHEWRSANTIRESALREAHKVMQEWTYCADAEEEILALIGEKK